MGIRDGSYFNKFTILLLIPLILSIGIAPAFQFGNSIQEAHALKSAGNPTAQFGSKTNVCGDKLCSEITGEYETIQEVTTNTRENLINPAYAATHDSPPNIIIIQPDDVGWFNIGAYHEGIMSGITPNIDSIAENGMRFTDYYADPSCTAGRASLVLGQLPIRTGLTTVGQAGAEIGMPDEAPTIAAILKSMGYNTGQFGKNHFGDLNRHLPTVHGFDEFYGYLYHLDALEDSFQPNYPQELNLIIGPRNLLHSWASNVDDPTIEDRWGKVGKQVIEDMGPVGPERMKTLDNEIRDKALDFMQRSVDEGEPFFSYINPSRMHVFTHLSDHYQSLRNSENGWTIYEAGMVELDDLVGEVLQFLDDNGIRENTIVMFTTDNGAEVFTWPDGGMTPFRGAKGQILEGGVRVPALIQWPGHIPAGVVENGLISGLDWLPTFIAAAGNPNITEELLEGKTINGKTYKVHLDGYNQLPMLKGEGESNRDVLFYFSQHNFGAIRIGDVKIRFIDQPNGWFGETVSLGWPMITNLRLDPFERAGWQDGDEGSTLYMDYFGYEFWRFVQAQQEIEKLVTTFVEYPPMQDPASFNLDSIKNKVESMKRAQTIGH